MSARIRTERLGVPFAALAIALLLATSGCGGGGGGSKPVAPWPPAGSIAEIEPNETPVHAQSLGTLTSSDLVVAGTASGTQDVDYFAVTLADPRSIFMSLSWTGAQDLEVGITDPNGIMILNHDTPSANPEACILGTPGAGTYWVRVGSHSTLPVTYLLTIGER